MAKFKQLPKLTWGLIIVVIIGVAFIWHKNTEKQNLINDVKFSFSGYNKDGTVTATIPAEDEKKIALMQLDYLKKKDFIDKSTAKTLKSLIEDAASIYSINTSSLTDSEKQVLNTVIHFNGQMLETKFSKSTGLSNGEKITYRWVVNNEDIPLKSGERTVTVKGLKKSKTLTAKEIKQKVKFKFYGFNGSGSVGIKENDLGIGTDSIKFSTPTNGKLTNNDKITVKITLDETALKEAGYVFSGTREFNLTVSDLVTLKNIKNLAEAKDVVDSRMEEDKNERTTIEPTGKWYVGADESSSSSYTSASDWLKSPSDITTISSSDLRKKRIVIGQFAKETHHYDEIVGGDDVEYEFVNSSFELDFTDNTIDLDSAEDGSTIDNVALDSLEDNVKDSFTAIE